MARVTFLFHKCCPPSSGEVIEWLSTLSTVSTTTTSKPGAPNSSPDTIISPSTAVSMPEVSFGRQVMYVAASSPWEAGPWLTRRGRHTRLSSDLPYGLVDCCPTRLLTLPTPTPGSPALSSSRPPCHTIFSLSYVSKDLPFFLQT